MPFGENSIDLGNGVLYMIKDGVLHSDSKENESITWAFDPASMVDSVKKADEFSFEVKLTPWQMIKIIFKHRGFWYTAAFIFTRMWNKLSASMANLLVRLKNMLKINLG